MTSPLVMRLVALSINSSKKAGEIIRNVMSSNQLNIVEKVRIPGHVPRRFLSDKFCIQSPRDYQTEADRSSQKCIIGSLAKQFPDVCIVGEEGESDLNNIPADWLVSDMDTDFLARYTCPESLKDVEAQNVIVW